MKNLFWELKNYFLIAFYFIFIFTFFNFNLFFFDFKKAFIDLAILIIFYLSRIELYAIYNKKFELNFFLVYFIFILIFNNINYVLFIGNVALFFILIIKVYTTFEYVYKKKYSQNIFRKSKVFADKGYLIQIEKTLEKVTDIILEIIFYNVSLLITIFIFSYFPFINNFYLFLFIFIVLFYSLNSFLFYIYNIIIRKLSLEGYILSLLSEQKRIFANFKLDLFLFVMNIFWIYFMATILYYSNLIGFEIFLTIVLSILIFNFILRYFENINEEILELLNLFVDVLERRDRYTFDHSNRVAYFSYYLAKEINLSIDEIDLVYKSASIHDIGKILVNDAILEKKGKLTIQEFEIIKLHVKELKNILLPIYPFFREIIDIAQLHHEKLDGSGYPFNLKDKQIPLYSRIITVADIFDALVLDRPYRPGFNYNKAINILIEEANKNKIDKYLVNVFSNISLNPEILENINKIKSMIRSYQVNLIKLISKGFSDFIDDIT
jgi:HD-GYP domain-containing protein (c-di-GMP phosphodiesterase class II)